MSTSPDGFIQTILQDLFSLFVESFGVLGIGASILLLILLMIIQAIIAPIASEAVLASAGGILNEAFPTFGIYAAIIGGIIGSLLGAMIAFYIARWIQKKVKDKVVDNYQELDVDESLSRKERFMNKLSKFLARFIDEDSDEFIEIIEERGFLIVLIGRILVFVPFDAVSYAAGFTKIKFKDFMIATTIGTIPRVIFYVLLGTHLASALENNFALFVGLFVLFAGGIYGLYKLIMRYLREDTEVEVETTNVELEDDKTISIPVEEDQVKVQEEEITS